MSTRLNRMNRIGPAVFVLAALLLAKPPSQAAQTTRVARESQRLARAGTDAQQAVTDLGVCIREMIEGYNAIVYGGTKNPESAFRRLASDRADVDRKIQGVVTAVEDMNVRAEQYFKEWQTELAGYASQNLRSKSVARLEKMKKRYAKISSTVAEAREAFTPLLESFDDQMLFLSRDLSPGTVADLGDDVLELNRRAESVFRSVDDLIGQVSDLETPPADVVSAESAD